MYARDYKEWFLCVKMLFKISVTGECAGITDFLFNLFTIRYAEKISKLEHKVTKMHYPCINSISHSVITIHFCYDKKVKAFLAFGSVVFVVVVSIVLLG